MTGKNARKIVTGFTIDRALRDKIDEIAKATDRSRSYVVSKAVQDWLDSQNGPIGLPYFGSPPKRVESSNVTEPVLVVPVGSLNKAGT